MTSRMDGESVKSMTRRSTPRPMPGGQRHAVLERRDEIFVHFDFVRFVLERHEFLLTRRRRGFALRCACLGVRDDLLLQTTTLVDRVRELAERVGELTTDDEEFKTLRHPGFAAVGLGERGNLERMVEHERGLNQVALARGFKHFVQDVSDARGRLDALDAFARFLRVRLERGNCRRLGAFQIVAERHDVDAGGLLDQVVRSAPRHGLWLRSIVKSPY